MAVLVSVASGKGGVGKSVISTNLGLLLAKMGYRVVVADLDVGGADAHILLGKLTPPLTLTDFLNKRIEHLDEAALSVGFHPNLRLIAGTGETMATANMPYARKKRLIKHFREIQADVIVIDVGAGTSHHALDFFLMADIHLAVATPEPTSALDLYRFIKLAAIRRVLAHFLTHSPIADVLSNRDFATMEELMTVAGAADEEGRRAADSALRSFRPGLVANRATGGSQLNLFQLRRLLYQYVGGDLTLLSSIPEDPAVPRAVRRFLPVVEVDPASPASRGLGRLAGSVVRLIEGHAPETLTECAVAGAPVEPQRTAGWFLKRLWRGD